MGKSRGECFPQKAGSPLHIYFGLIFLMEDALQLCAFRMDADPELLDFRWRT